MTPARRRWIAALAAALAPLAAAAGPEPRSGGPPLDARFGLVEVALRGVRFDYAEYGTRGTFLDGETGLVPQLSGALELWAGPLSLRGGGSLGSTTLDYVGLVQSGNAATNGLLVRSRSDARLAALEAQVGVELPRALGIAVVAGIARRRWEREIRDTTVLSRSGALVPVRGLSETYEWVELHAGVRLPLLRRADVAWDAEARITRTRDPTVTVLRSPRDVELPLGVRTGYGLGSTLRVALGRVLFARAALALERLDLGASPRDPATGLFEPASETRTASLDLGIGARL